MAKWTDFFDKIFLVNLEKRKDRLEQATAQLNHYSIPFERVEAIENENGAEGLRLTMDGIFNEATNNGYQNVLVFEDDLHIIEENFNQVMENVIQDVPKEYDIVYLGCNLCRTPSKWYNEHLIQINSAFSTHAVFYSAKGIKKIRERNPFSPVDNHICQYVQDDNCCYATFPFLVSQIVSKSDIYTAENEMNWKKWLEIQFADRLEMMKMNGILRPQLKQLTHG